MAEMVRSFINENLSPANESIAYNCRKLRRAKINDSCCSRDGIICIKSTANSKLHKIHHMKELRDSFPEFGFSNNEENIPHAEHDVVNVSSNSATV